MESTIEIYSPEWFINRQGNFTGSEIWKLMTEARSKKDVLSKTAETYILEKVWEKLSGEVKQGINNMATEWGNDNEPTAKKFYSSVTGNEVKDSLMLYSNEIQGLTGSPDGLVGEDGLIEIKCPYNGANHLKYCFITKDETFLSEQPEYYYQMQCYMLLSGRKWCDFVSFDPRIISDLGLFIYRVNANEEVIEKMTEKVKLARELFNQYFESFNGKKG
jgi:putative phage-type endonuclease